MPFLDIESHFLHFPYKMGVFAVPTTQEGAEALSGLGHYTHKKNIIKSRNVLCVFDALERHMWRYVRRPCYVAALVSRTPQFTENSLSETGNGQENQSQDRWE